MQQLFEKKMSNAIKDTERSEQKQERGLKRNKMSESSSAEVAKSESSSAEVAMSESPSAEVATKPTGQK